MERHIEAVDTTAGHGFLPSEFVRNQDNPPSLPAIIRNFIR